MLKHSWKMPYIYCNGTVFYLTSLIEAGWMPAIMNNSVLNTAPCSVVGSFQRIGWKPSSFCSAATAEAGFPGWTFPQKRVRACSAGCTRRSTTSSTTSPRDRRRRRWGWRWWTESRESSTTCGPALRYLPHSPNTLLCSLCSPASLPLENSSCSWLLENVKTQHMAWLGTNCWNNECFKKMLTAAQLLTLDATLFSLPWPS